MLCKDCVICRHCEQVLRVRQSLNLAFFACVDYHARQKTKKIKNKIKRGEK